VTAFKLLKNINCLSRNKVNFTQHYKILCPVVVVVMTKIENLSNLWQKPQFRKLSFGHCTFEECDQGCQIFLGTANQNGKNVPNNHKIYQMATKYSK
jgi:hypothetical protein